MPATTYLWDDDNLLAEFQAGSLSTKYTYEPQQYGNLISDQTGANYSQYHYDAIGSTVDVTNDQQQPWDSTRYSAFGQQAAIMPKHFSFCGRVGYYYDVELDSFYVRQRSYSNNEARWLSVEPFGTDFYAYVNNAPLNEHDPSGLFGQATIPIKELFAVLGKDPWPERRPCGGYAWFTRFDLADDESNGLIIQKVCFTITAKPTFCPGQPKKCDDDKPTGIVCSNDVKCGGNCYYELWRVYRGGVFSQLLQTLESETDPKADEAGLIPLPFDDVFARFGCKDPCTHKSSGKITQSGDAIFVPLKAVITGFGPKWASAVGTVFKSGRGAVLYACNLRSACDDAPGIAALYAKLAKLAVGGVSHKEITSEWDCCKECSIPAVSAAIDGVSQIDLKAETAC